MQGVNEDRVCHVASDPLGIGKALLKFNSLTSESCDARRKIGCVRWRPAAQAETRVLEQAAVASEGVLD